MTTPPSPSAGVKQPYWCFISYRHADNAEPGRQWATWLHQQIETMLESGIPEEGRAYLGMMGFKIRINLHGELMEVIQPGIIDPDSE